MKSKIGLLIIFAFGLSSCESQPMKNLARGFGINRESEYPKNIPKVRKLAKYQSDSGGQTRFENADLSFEYSPNLTLSQINFKLTNKTKSPIKLLWDESAFVIAGSSEKIIPEGTRLISKTEARPPLFVAPKSFATSFFAPASAWYYSDRHSQWLLRPICGELMNPAPEFEEVGEEYVEIPPDQKCAGTSYSIHIAYEVGGKHREISLKFKHAGFDEIRPTVSQSSR